MQGRQKCLKRTDPSAKQSHNCVRQCRVTLLAITRPQLASRHTILTSMFTCSPIGRGTKWFSAILVSMHVAGASDVDYFRDGRVHLYPHKRCTALDTESFVSLHFQWTPVRKIIYSRQEAYHNLCWIIILQSFTRERVGPKPRYAYCSGGGTGGSCRGGTLATEGARAVIKHAGRCSCVISPPADMVLHVLFCRGKSNGIQEDICSFPHAIPSQFEAQRRPSSQQCQTSSTIRNTPISSHIRLRTGG